jgi:hypothetical protein
VHLVHKYLEEANQFLHQEILQALSLVLLKLLLVEILIVLSSICSA